MKINRQQHNKALLLLLLLSFIVRVPIFWEYHPRVLGDTAGYELVAVQIKTLDFADYNGSRTPGYPLLLLLCNMNYNIIWLVQSVFGVAISLMLFDISCRHTQNIILSFLIGLSNSVCLNLIFFEANLATETMAAFFIVVPLWLLTRIIYGRDKNKIIYWALSGISIGCAAMTKPFLAFLVPVYFAFIILHDTSISLRHPRSLLNKNLLVSVGTATIIILGLCTFNKLTLNYFGLSTLTGYSLTQHSGAFIEFAPDKYSIIKDVYLKYRDDRIKKSGTHAMTIWRAIDEMKDKTGLSYAELSKELTSMSLKLFIAHPFRYFQTIGAGLLNFWKVPMSWSPSKIEPTILRICIQILWFVEQLGLFLANIIFVIGGLMYLVSIPVRNNNKSHLILLIICIVFSGSILQACLEYGDNERYSLPFQPLILFVTFVWVYNALRHFYLTHVQVLNHTH